MRPGKPFIVTLGLSNTRSRSEPQRSVDSCEALKYKKRMPKEIKRVSNVALCFAIFFWCCIASAQISQKAPEKWITCRQIYIGLSISDFRTSDNSPDQISQELRNTNTIQLIAKSGGLSGADLETLVVVSDPAQSQIITLYQIGGSSERPLSVMKERLHAYCTARSGGHTKECLFMALTNAAPKNLLADEDLRILLTELPLIPVSRLKFLESGAQTNKAGQFNSATATASTVDGKKLQWSFPKYRRLMKCAGGWFMHTLMQSSNGNISCSSKLTVVSTAFQEVVEI